MAPIVYLPTMLIKYLQILKEKIAISSYLTRLAIMFLLLMAGPLASETAHAQVVASFTADDTAGCAPLTVHFTNTSTGATSYTWNVGEGPTYYTTDVVESYLTAGTYTVTLTAINGTITNTSTLVIKVYPPPTVLFSGSDTLVCPNSPVTFTSTSIPGSWGSLTYNWNFGDGYTSTASAPSHSYSSPGYYNVTLFATNVKGCSNSLTKPNYIHVQTPPTESFSAATTFFCKPPAAVSFVNSTTGSMPITYKWYFGDGGSALSTSPTHIYTSSGSYSVTLISTDNKGCKDTLIVPNYVTIGNLHAAFTSLPVSCGAIPVTFTNTSSTHISSKWFFGDGDSSTSETGLHTYTAPGTFTVKLVVFDGTCYDTITHPINISYPTGGTFNILPLHPCPPPSLLTFAGTAPSGCTVSWVFDDGSMLTGPTVTHTYSSSRIYSTSMVVTNSLGCTDTIIKLDTLYNLNLNPSPSLGDSCIPVTNHWTVYDYSVVYNPFTLTSMFLAYPVPISSYTWRWADGTPNSTSATPTHTYTAVGRYADSCTIVTANGCTITAVDTIRVGTPQSASFTCSPTRICTGHTINFTSTSTSSSLIDFYHWNFQDGTDTVGPNVTHPPHTFTEPGIYNVLLSVGYNGCYGLPFQLHDTVDSPGAMINYHLDCSPASCVTFIDTSLGETSHTWMFGDGTTSTAHLVDHCYPVISLFNIKLATLNSTTGCRDTASVSVNLTRANITFLPIDTAICKGQSDTITSNVTVRTAVQNHWYDNGVLLPDSGAHIYHNYPTSGIHNIVLVIKDNYGCYDTSYTIHMLAAKPADSFALSPPSGCGPLAVTFTDHTTDVSGVVLSSYNWNFGDGTPPGLGAAVTSHTYSTAGTYSIQEIVTDNAGCADTFTSATHVIVHHPVASFSVTATTVCAGTSIHFINTSTGITSSLWLFGDGTTSTLNSPAHPYASAGVYTVKLVVNDSYGCHSDTLTMPGLITINFSPSASFTMSDSFAVCPPLNVNFTNTSTGSVSSYWDFGDTRTSYFTSPSNVYIASGLYHVYLVATATNGCTDTARHNVSMFGYTGAFSYTPLSGCTPLHVHFTAIGTSVDSFTWSYGDGGGFSGVLADTISHNYLHSGNYLPKLVLKDSFGCTTGSYGLDTIRVDTVAPKFTISPNPACQYSPVTFTDISTSGSYFPMTGWMWSFGSGATSTVHSPSYTFSVSGVHTVTLTVTDSSGCSGTVTHTVTVNPAPPPISGVSIVCKGNCYLFTDALGLGTWTSSNPSVASVGSGTGMVCGSAIGTSTITYTSGPGCPAVKAVTVAASPSSITGINNMCIGLTSTYTDSVPGGTWSIAPLTVATVSPTGVVGGIAPGIATLTYTLGSCTATKVVTITSVPSVITGPSTVCTGTSVTLLDSIPGGIWSSTSSHVSVVSGSGLVTGSSTGTAVITYSLGVGCTRTKTVTVNLLSPITGPTGVCVGGIIPLADSISGGTWSSSAPGIALVGTGSVTIIGVASGSATIYYTLPDGCIATHPVTVHGLPSPIGGNVPVCQFATETLTDTAGGGTWSITPLTIGTIDPLAGALTGLLTGTATVTYSLGSTGCQTTSVITVNPAPAPIGGIAHVCQLSTTTLTDVTSPGTWSCSSALASVGTSSGIVTGISSGIAPVTYTAASNGCSITRNVTVNPLPSVISGPSSSCIGVPATYTDTMTGTTWSQSTPARASIIPTSGILTGTSAGPDTVINTNLSTGCKSTKAITITSAPDSIIGASAVCVGSTATLSDATTGGTWTASNSLATIGSSSGVVHGITPGTDTITYSVGVGCAVTKIITIIAVPAPITGINHVCAGAIDTLTDPTVGGTWNSSNMLVATTDGAGHVTGISPGTTIINYSVGPGCTVPFSLTVNISPSGITGNNYVCLGSTTNLYDITPSGVWSSSNSLIAPVSPTGVVTGSGVGSAIISYTISSGCTATKTMTVILVPAITGLPTSKCAFGDTLNINDSAVGGVFTSAVVTVTNLGGGYGKILTHTPGLAAVTYTMPTGCYTTSLMTVNPLPDIIMGNYQACMGLTSLLTDGTPGGVWSSPGYSSILTVGSSSGIVTGISVGSAIVTYTIPLTGCYKDTSVTVWPQPSSISGPNAVCAGATISMSDSVSGGVWSSNHVSIATVGATTGIVSGSSSGTDTIIYTLGSHCSSYKPITVYPLPTIFTTVGGGNYCLGGTGVPVSLSSSQTGVMYQLYDGIITMGTPFSGTGSVLNFGMQTASGTYTVIATSTATSCSATMLSSAIVGINPPPTGYVITGGGGYCADSPGIHIGLAGSSSGTNYQLLFGTLPVGPLTAGTGSALNFGVYSSLGTYKVFATNVTTTCTGYMPDSVNVSIAPTVVPSVSISLSPGDTVCAGTPVNFTASSINGGSSPVYHWLVNGSGGATGATYTYSPANSDVVSVKLKSNATCPLPDTAVNSVVMNVDPLVIPVVTISANPGTTITPGQTVTLVAVYTNGGPAPTFQWYKNGVLIPGATSDTLVLSNAANNDSLTCVVTGSGPCGNQPGAHSVIIVVNNVGVLQLNSTGEIKVLPNPNKGDFTVKGSLGSLADEEVTLELTDVIGQVVYKGMFIARNGIINEHVRPDNSLANGVYLLSIHSDTENRVFHVIIEQ